MHDNRLSIDTIAHSEFSVLEYKYYLDDVEYLNSNYIIISYQDI